MAKIFKITSDKEDNHLDDDEIDELIILDDQSNFKEMIFWLLENDIQYHFFEDESTESAILVLKDDNVMAFKLRWA